MRQKLPLLATAVLVAGALGCAHSPPTISERFGVPTITKEQLKPRLGAPRLVVLDVRLADDWKASGQKVAGAAWEEAERVDSWAGKYSKTDDIVLYCA